MYFLFFKAASTSYQSSLTAISHHTLLFSLGHPLTLSLSHSHPFQYSMATEPTWPQLLGSNNWETLLEPLNPHLRALILRCGDFIQATYDAFNNDKNSLYCGSSRYGKSSFFHKVMLDHPDHYDAVSFLYATARISVPEAFLLHSLSREAWDRESNWIGYVAVTSDQRSRTLGRREIYVVWRGTTRDLEWINVFGAVPESATGLLSAKSLNEFRHGNKDGKIT